jgi:tetratricopeptide (TPR) repeat protein
VFVQAMIREVAYNTLAKRDRRSRHLAAARYFETLESDELAAAVAGHLLAAHRHSSPGPEAEAVAHQARIALRAAAERAAALGAHEQAVSFLEQAITVAAAALDQADLLDRAGRAASDAGQHDRAEGFLRRALEVRASEGDALGASRTLAMLGSALLIGFRINAAVEALETGLAGLEDRRSEPEPIRLAAELARARMMSGRLVDAVELADETLAIAERDDLVDVVADLLATKGASLADLGRSYEGIGIARAAIGLADAHGLARIALRARSNLVATLIPRDPVAGVREARKGIDDARRLSATPWLVSLVGNGAEAAHWTGEWPWALQEAELILAADLDRSDRGFLLTAIVPILAWMGRSVTSELAEIAGLLAGMDDPDTLSTVHAARSHAAFAAGDLGTARRESLARGRLSPINASLAYALAARAALWSGDHESLRADLAALRETGARGIALQLTTVALDAAIAAVEGRHDEAMGMYRTALRGWRDASLPVPEAMTAIDMAVTLGLDRPEVRDALNAGRMILADLGARPFVERIDALLAQRPGIAEVAIERGAARVPSSELLDRGVPVEPDGGTGG